MPKKSNPLNLNPLQLKTLTLLQALAKLPDHAKPADDGAIMVANLPQPHGDHFHLGPHVVMSRDATGLANEAAWDSVIKQSPQHGPRLRELLTRK